MSTRGITTILLDLDSPNVMWGVVDTISYRVTLVGGKEGSLLIERIHPSWVARMVTYTLLYEDPNTGLNNLNRLLTEGEWL